MEILIREDAGEIYETMGIFDPHWEVVLWEISGKIVEVDTEELFKYEFNTKPIPNVSEEGIRVPIEFVSKVIGDIRKGKARCDFCNKTSDSDRKCSHCGRSDYLEPFYDEFE